MPNWLQSVEKSLDVVESELALFIYYLTISIPLFRQSQAVSSAFYTPLCFISISTEQTHLCIWSRFTISLSSWICSEISHSAVVCAKIPLSQGHMQITKPRAIFSALIFLKATIKNIHTVLEMKHYIHFIHVYIYNFSSGSADI